MNLSDLIEAHKAGRSYAELSRDCGGKPTDKRLHQMKSRPMLTFPDPETVSGLARGLKVSERTVVLSIAESLGLDVASGTPRLVELLPAGTRDLTEQQAAAIAHLIRSFTDTGAGETAAEREERRFRTEPKLEDVYKSWIEDSVARKIDGEPLTADEEERFAAAIQYFHDSRPDFVFHAAGSGEAFVVEVKEGVATHLERSGSREIVMGYLQSGKTSSMLAVIRKLEEAGYRPAGPVRRLGDAASGATTAEQMQEIQTRAARKPSKNE